MCRPGGGAGPSATRRGQEAAEGLAPAGRGDEESGRVGSPVEEGELMGVRGPAAAGEPAGEGLGEGGLVRHRGRWRGTGGESGVELHRATVVMWLIALGKVGSVYRKATSV